MVVRSALISREESYGWVEESHGSFVSGTKDTF
jgi:hypothetical protein